MGAGATKFRSNTAAKLLDTLKITILRGNAGEIGMGFLFIRYH